MGGVHGVQERWWGGGFRSNSNGGQTREVSRIGCRRVRVRAQ